MFNSRPLISGQVRPRQGTEICNFGAPSPLEALHWIFCFFSSIYVQISKTSPLKSGESRKIQWRKSRQILSRLWLSWFFLALIIWYRENGFNKNLGGGGGGPKLAVIWLGKGEVRVYRGTGVSHGVRRTTWDRSLKNWELQIPCFEEFFWGGNTLGLVPASLPHTLGYACTFYAPTSPPPIGVSRWSPFSKSIWAFSLAGLALNIRQC